MKEAYGLTQGQLELIGAAHNLGGYSSFISGLVYDALERRHHVGPRISLLFGCTSSFFGFAGLWAALTNFRGFHPTVPQLALIALIAGNGGTWFDTCTLATNLRNFPASRGTVVGLVKASVGLSASLYASAYTSVFQPAADRFLLFLALMPTVVGLVAMPLVNYVPFVQRSETDRGQSIFSTEGRFLFALQSIGTLALYLMATAIVNGTHELSQATRGILGGGVIFLLLPIGLIPYGSGGLFAERMPKPGSGRASAIEEAALESGQHGRSGVDEPLLGAAPGGVETPTPEQDDDEDLPLPATITPSVTVGECFRLLNFWLLAVVCCIGIGSGLAFLNNAAQLVAALEGPEETRSVLVSLFGVASCGGEPGSVLPAPTAHCMEDGRRQHSALFFFHHSSLRMNRFLDVACRAAAVWFRPRKRAAHLRSPQAGLPGRLCRFFHAHLRLTRVCHRARAVPPRPRGWLRVWSLLEPAPKPYLRAIRAGSLCLDLHAAAVGPSWRWLRPGSGPRQQNISRGAKKAW